MDNGRCRDGKPGMPGKFLDKMMGLKTKGNSFKRHYGYNMDISLGLSLAKTIRYKESCLEMVNFLLPKLPKTRPS